MVPDSLRIQAAMSGHAFDALPGDRQAWVAPWVTSTNGTRLRISGLVLTVASPSESRERGGR